MIPKPDIPVSYLLSCSRESLHNIVLKNRNRAAEFRKTIREATDDAIQAEGLADLAQWLLDNGEALMGGGASEQIAKPGPQAVPRDDLMRKVG